MRLWVSIVISMVAAPAAAQFFHAQGGSGQEHYVAPGELFYVELPSGWSTLVNPSDPDTVEFRPAGNYGDASLFVRRVTVPAGAAAKQLMLTGIEQRLNKLPSFKMTVKKGAKIGGKAAAAVAGQYYYQGNAQFPRAVEEVYFVEGTDAFIFHFECFAPVAAEFAKILDTFYKSFIARPPKSLTNAAPPSSPGSGLDLPIDPNRIAF